MVARKKDVEEAVVKPSRSAKKRESLALQKLGEELAALGAEERLKLNLPEDLANALHEYDLLKDKEARRRQRQYIGRLMRETPAGEIEESLKKRRNIRLAHAAGFHKTEKWRDKLMAASVNELHGLVASLLSESGGDARPELKETLITLTMKAVEEKNNGAAKGASRQLFREIAALFR